MDSGRTINAPTQIHDLFGPAPESTSLIRLRSRYGMFINNRFRRGKHGEHFTTWNPATGEPIAEVAYAREDDIDEAVHAARTALSPWAALPGKDRSKFLFRIARLLQERAREFSLVETIDNGKPIREARTVDIPLAIAHFFYYAGWADKLHYAFFGQDVRPVGVAAQIIPWNFPLLMAAWKIAPALACGNTVVLKPAESSPLTALLLAEVIQDAGLPPGVVNIVPGDGETGASLVRHPGIDKVAFTGSTEVGRTIQASLAGRPVRYTLELGGKSANIVFEDAAPDQAVEGIINSIFFNQGQVCCAGSRLLVQESIADLILQRLKDRMSTLIVGDPLDKNTDIGAIHSPQQLERITGYLDEAQGEGLELYQPQCSLPDKGCWCRPTLVLNASQSSRIVEEEVFGPVLTVQTFRTPEEAVQRAQNTRYGLAGGVWTEKGSRALAVARELRAGVVWANTYNRFDPTSPFGGFRESGVGREGGVHGLAPYVECGEEVR
jgi:aldehyde dehydrogenase (NAD+)